MNLPWWEQAYDLLFVFMGVMLIELTPFRARIYVEQVKLSTTKLRQNKEKNRNSDF